MSKLKAGLFTVAGVTIGILTLRTFRQRRGSPEDDEEPPADAVRTEAQAAVEHATAAVSHARAAGEKAAEVIEMEVTEMRTTTTDDGDETEPLPPVRRLRRVGKGWIRK